MSLINVTTWSGRKLHLAIGDAVRQDQWGNTHADTLSNADAVLPGSRWVRYTGAGLMTQERIDALEPCKKCEKRRASMAKDGAQ